MNNIQNPIQILLYNSENSFVERINAILKEDKLLYAVHTVSEIDELHQKLVQQFYDILIIGVVKNDNPLGVLKFRNENHPFIPILIILEPTNDSSFLQLIEAGADECISIEDVEKIGFHIRKSIKRKKREKATQYEKQNLTYEKEFYRNIFELSPIGLILEDSEGKILDANGSILKVTGYTKNELVGKNISIFAPPEEKEKVLNDIKEILKGNTLRQEVININKDNKRRHHTEIIESRIQLPDGSMGILSINNDISLRKKVEEDLLKSNKSLAMAQQIGKIGTWDYDLMDDKLFWSDGVYDQFGLKPGTVFPSQNLFLSFVHPDDKHKVNEAIKNVFENNSDYDLNIRMLKNDGTEWIGHTIGALIKNEKGQVTHFLGIQQDITDLTKITKELIEAKEKAEESNRLKSEFLTNLSHEIRTPMNGIIGFASLLEQESLNNDEKRNFAQIIINSSKQLLRIIDDILEISKLQTKQIKIIKEEVNLSDILLELFSIFDLKAKQSGLHMYLKNQLQDDEFRIQTDASKLKKILSNLLENAFKFTKEGYIELGLKKEYDTYIFHVKDTGLGIKKEMQKIIFERFSQEEKEISQKSGGLGLGLSIAMENAQLLGGSVCVESEKGEGSTFYVKIPFGGKKNTEEMKQNKKEITEQTATILVAKDEEVNYQYIEILLRKFPTPVKIFHVVNGQEAVSFCQKGNKVDLILMDIKMPLMNGIEATRLIRKTHPDLPIIAQTAYARVEDKEEALAAGCNEYLSKPFRKDHFYKTIFNYLS
ncbi:MAG: PAS domain S-box protein [Bacteroidales bacterium]|nr:PAS domain S-box protein [Bacteroidales bacterium]